MSPSTTQRTRVLLMATSMRGGGSEHQVALLAEHLPRDRFDVHLYLTHAEGVLLERIPGDVRIHSWSHGVGSDSSGRSGIERLLDRWPGTILRRQALDFAEIVNREWIDVIYDRAFHNTMIAGHPSIRGLVRARRVSTIVSPPHVALPMVEKRFVGAKRRLLADAYRRSDQVIAVSSVAADSAARYYGLPREQIAVVANPVDVDEVRKTAGVPREVPPSGEPANQPVSTPSRAELRLVCVGRMTPEKGQADLVEAIGMLPSGWPEGLRERLVVRFIGDGPNRRALETRWRQICRADGTVDGHRAEFVGAISPAVCEIARADGLVLPSHFEGMPNVVLEAFALGVPVVATRSGGTVDLQADPSCPTCFWAEPGDPASIAKALWEFAEDPQRREGHVRAAGELIRGDHAIGRAIERIGGFLHG
ncbi:glycosyltransferase [Rhodopirellula sallentina]|uniref:Glycosyl transferase group 1 n=1 Tax=Rhodopirellula sallentina SM41 TaxID=1263870 RepID=M5TT64_9BACT|nr:glycosyltransferase [Rhodopirellula sallentina]EMI52234.1 glycosyl transferase group 1 [Rhodopirellula sallentina SM41]